MEVQLKLIRYQTEELKLRSVTPTGSSSKAQGKRSAALGTEVPFWTDPEGVEHLR